MEMSQLMAEGHQSYVWWPEHMERYGQFRMLKHRC